MLTQAFYVGSVGLVAMGVILFSTLLYNENENKKDSGVGGHICDKGKNM
jgi:cell division septation protein DedD